MPRDVFPRRISRGVLAGRTFATKWQYQQARARELGFVTYSEERRSKENPAFILARERARDRLGQSHTESLLTARRTVGTLNVPKGAKGAPRSAMMREEMRRSIRDVIQAGLWDSGDEAADDMYYE